MKQRHVVDSFFLKSHQKFSEAIEPRMGNFNNPSARLISFFHGNLLFSSGSNMGNKSMFTYYLFSRLPCVTGIGAQIFFNLFFRSNDSFTQNCFQLRHVMPIRAGYDD